MAVKQKWQNNDRVLVFFPDHPIKLNLCTEKLIYYYN